MFNLKDSTTVPTIRLGLQGAPCSGKTWAAVTFPNPIIADFDGGTTALRGRDIRVVPFYDERYVVETFGAKLKQGLVDGVMPYSAINRRDAFRKWLDTDASKLLPNDTLILDSWTAIQNAFDFITEAEPVYSEKGKLDEYSFWRRKVFWSCDVMEKLKSLQCNVVVNFHEIQARDKATGMILEKYQPLQDGKFVTELKAHFTDFYRQHALSKVDNAGKPTLVNGQPLTKDGWYWQIKSDAAFDAKCRVPNMTDKLVEANYSFFTKNYK